MIADLSGVCQREHHELCGGNNCTCTCHPGTPEERRQKIDVELADWLTEFGEVVQSTGRHEGHTLKQVGSCVYCSCGYRYQGSLPKPAAS